MHLNQLEVLKKLTPENILDMIDYGILIDQLEGGGKNRSGKVLDVKSLKIERTNK